MDEAVQHTNVIFESTPQGNSYFYDLYFGKENRVMARKPPIGLAPTFKVDYDREEVDVKRGIEIVEAMHRYLKRDTAVPCAWFEELEVIYTSMAQRRAEGDFKDGTVKNL